MMFGAASTALITYVWVYLYARTFHDSVDAEPNAVEMTTIVKQAIYNDKLLSLLKVSKQNTDYLRGSYS